MALYSQTAEHNLWPSVGTKAGLPNVAGSPIQGNVLQVADTCYVTSERRLYQCTIATPGAAVWLVQTPYVYQACWRQNGQLTIVSPGLNVIIDGQPAHPGNVPLYTTIDAYLSLQFDGTAGSGTTSVRLFQRTGFATRALVTTVSRVSSGTSNTFDGVGGITVPVAPIPVNTRWEIEFSSLPTPVQGPASGMTFSIFAY